MVGMEYLENDFSLTLGTQSRIIVFEQVKIGVHRMDTYLKHSQRRIKRIDITMAGVDNVKEVPGTVRRKTAVEIARSVGFQMCLLLVACSSKTTMYVTTPYSLPQMVLDSFWMANRE